MRYILFILMLFSYLNILSSNIYKNTPFIGAQVFIEPGQSEEEIESLFSTLRDNNMNFCRIRMFESYMNKGNGVWNYSLFDKAFNMADKYGIKVYATLFPYVDFLNVGGFKNPNSLLHLENISEYIKRVVTHFSKYDCLDTWVLINEPGITSYSLSNDLTKRLYEEWRLKESEKKDVRNKFQTVDFNDKRFVNYYNTWYIKWLSERVREIDKEHDLHINPHNIFSMYHIYDFSSLRNNINSLGGSAHASWHFNYFPRERYALAMSATAEMLSSASSNLPWMMTEIQGGPNLYSGNVPLSPTSEEITQWLLINLTTEAKGCLFWSLNCRASGLEAGEWGLLDYERKPTDRLHAVSRITKLIKEKPEIFSNIRNIKSGISILYNNESAWLEEFQMSWNKKEDSRIKNAVFKSSLGYFGAITELGLQCDIINFSDYDFSKDSYTGKMIILSHQISLTSEQIDNLINFVSKGGNLVIDGLSGFYDEHSLCTFLNDFRLRNLVGAFPLEVYPIDSIKYYNYLGKKLPTCMFESKIKLLTAQSLLCDNVIGVQACINEKNKGKVIWIPSCVGLEAYKSNDYKPLALFLKNNIPDEIMNSILHFEYPEEKIIMKSFMAENQDYYSLVINKSDDYRKIRISGINMSFSDVIFSDNKVEILDNEIIIPNETIAIIKIDMK